ncbi:MAG: DUF6084 family protein [Candidatus Nanopelagicales bacterium]
MSELEFTVLDVMAEQYSAFPSLLFRLHLAESTGEQIHAVALRCQIRIEPQRRQYTDAETAGLTDLFGGRERWSETLKPFLWAHASTMVRGFTDSIDVDLPVACTYDFEVSGAKYLHALADGEVPLILLFSGTVFTRGANGFGVEQIPWHLEAKCRMPVQVWRQCMDFHYPNSGWIRLDRGTLDALIQYKATLGVPTWEQAFDTLLAPAGAPLTAPVEETVS